jgi:hypothetical protein
MVHLQPEMSFRLGDLEFKLVASPPRRDRGFLRGRGLFLLLISLPPSAMSKVFKPPQPKDYSIDEFTQVGIRDLEKRFRSKKELHDFMLQDCRAYLPRLESTSIFFMKDIICGRKEVRRPPLVSFPFSFMSMTVHVVHP